MLLRLQRLALALVLCGTVYGAYLSATDYQTEMDAAAADKAVRGAYYDGQTARGVYITEHMVDGRIPDELSVPPAPASACPFADEPRRTAWTAGYNGDAP